MSVRVVIDTARPGLQAIHRRSTDGLRLHKIIARSAQRATRDRFAHVASWMRNKFGRPAKFWKRMSRATRNEATSHAAFVLVPSEVAQRYYGGPIKPTGGRRFLTIPAAAVSYRRSARTFRDLKFILFRHPKGSAAGMIVRPRKTGKDEVLYWLVRGVVQKGDRRVLPTSAEYQAAIGPDVTNYLLRASAPRPSPIT